MVLENVKRALQVSCNSFHLEYCMNIHIFQHTTGLTKWTCNSGLKESSLLSYSCIKINIKYKYINVKPACPVLKSTLPTELQHYR